jgi:hypothetical protein
VGVQPAVPRNVPSEGTIRCIFLADGSGSEVSICAAFYCLVRPRVAQAQSGSLRLLTGGLLVRIQPEEPAP